MDAVVTVKSTALTAALQPTTTEIFPVSAPDGTVVVMLVEVLDVTVAFIALKNSTVFSPGVVLKFVPIMVTEEHVEAKVHTV